MRRSTIKAVVVLATLTVFMAGCGADVEPADSSLAADSVTTMTSQPSDDTGGPASTDVSGSEQGDHDGSPPSVSGSDDADQANEDGISVEQAESIEALTGDYDMLLTGPHSIDVGQDGCLQATYKAENVGKLTDRYRFETDQGDVDPAEVRVEAGQAETLTVTVCDLDQPAFVLNVLAADRGDELLDQVTSP